jgi:hypothetical protein
MSSTTHTSPIVTNNSNDLFTDLYDSYKGALALGDPLVKDYPLMNPLICLLIISLYLATVFILIQIMKRREKPVDVYYLALFHNINLTVLSAYMFIEIIRQAYLNNYSLWYFQ